MYCTACSCSCHNVLHSPSLIFIHVFVHYHAAVLSHWTGTFHWRCIHGADGIKSVFRRCALSRVNSTRRHWISGVQAWPSNLPWQGMFCRSLHSFIGQTIHPTTMNTALSATIAETINQGKWNKLFSRKHRLSGRNWRPIKLNYSSI